MWTAEFCDPLSIEIDTGTGEVLSHAFFCDSYASYSKGVIEEDHTLLRYILPKGVIFDHLTQEQADLITSHINGYVRKSVAPSSCDLAPAFWGENILSLLHCSCVSHSDVCLSPKFLK